MSFGHSAVLNRKLQQVLANQPSSDCVKGLTQLNNFCNNLETTITQKMGKNSIVSDLDPLIDMLVGVKAHFATLIDEYFPMLDYSTREVIHYEKESLSFKSQWKAEIAAALQGKATKVFYVDEEVAEGASSS